MHYLTRLMFGLTATVIFFSNYCFSQKWDAIYRADKLPEKSGWELDDGFGAGVQKWWMIMPDSRPHHLTNEILHIEDRAGRRVMWYKAFEGEGNPPGITVVARVKSLWVKDLHLPKKNDWQGKQERNIGLSNGFSSSDEVSFWPNRVQLGIGLPVGEKTITYDLDGQEWHTYRITCDELGIVRIYVDGLGPVLEMTGGIDPDHWRAVHMTKIGGEPIGPAVTFGTAQAHDSVQDLYFDYVLVDFSGAYPPGGVFPRGLMREYLSVNSLKKVTTLWGSIKSVRSKL